MSGAAYGAFGVSALLAGWLRVFGMGGWPWLRTVMGLPSIPLPDQSSPPGMPDLPADMFLVLLRDAVLPPLLVLVAGLLIGWILVALWKRQA